MIEQTDTGALADAYDLASEREARRPHLRVRWFETWRPELDAALRQLPEMETCPNELFGLLVRNGSAAKKRIALVSERGRPTAVIGLRRRRFAWASVCDGVIPGAIAPAAPGRLWDSIAALGKFVWVNDWTGPLPRHPNVFCDESLPVYRFSTDVDLDAFWSERGNVNALKKARRRCERAGGTMEFEVDHPDAARWILDGWERDWCDDPWVEHLSASDLRIAAAYLGARGMQHTFRLLHDGRPVVGFTAFAGGDTLYPQHSHRDPAYDRLGVGVRLDEMFFRWTQTTHYRTVDLGGGFAYKARWAVQDAVRTRFAIAPRHLVVARTAAYTMRTLRGSLAERWRSGTGANGSPS